METNDIDFTDKEVLELAKVDILALSTLAVYEEKDDFSKLLLSLLCFQQSAIIRLFEKIEKLEKEAK